MVLLIGYLFFENKIHNIQMIESLSYVITFSYFH